MNEKIYHQKGPVSVTTTMANFGNTNYPVANIGAVSVDSSRATNWGGVAILVIIGLVLFSMEVPIGGLIAIAIAGFLIYSSLQVEHRLILRTSSGNTQAFASKSQKEVEEIRDAIVRSIAERG